MLQDFVNLRLSSLCKNATVFTENATTSTKNATTSTTTGAGVVEITNITASSKVKIKPLWYEGVLQRFRYMLLRFLAMP